MPRLVRRRPLSERIKAWLDPWDGLLWLLEELNSSDWEEFTDSWATTIGIAANLLFIISRANSGGSNNSSGYSDVFADSDSRHGTGWLRWTATFFVQILSLLSFANAFYTFYRRRHYRLFEQNIEEAPSTPSAQRVRVDSSPSASPLQILSNLIAAPTAESRAHPDSARDVWELAIWDPTPLCLRIFCIFSPGHIIVYRLFLPLAPLDPRPSVTIAKTVFLGALLSFQLYGLYSHFIQQNKDNAIISKQVLNEYNTKFVHPTLNRPVRDVATQTRVTTSSTPTQTREVDTYTPVTVINRGFRVNPNPAYASQYDPDNLSNASSTAGTGAGTTAFQQRLQRASTPNNPTPTTLTSSTYFPPPSSSSASTAPDFSSPLRPRASPAKPHHRSSDASTGAGDGGSLGVYSHAASPLRKAASANYLREKSSDGGGRGGGGGGSPLKRMSLADRDAQTSAYSGRGIGRRESGRL